MVGEDGLVALLEAGHRDREVDRLLVGVRAERITGAAVDGQDASVQVEREPVGSFHQRLSTDGDVDLER